MPARATKAAGVKQDSRAEYAARMHRVLAYIDQHLDQPLSLDTLAGVAHFSPFHFHRLFAAWMGETLGDYLWRRRVEVAASRFLAQPKVPVLDMALAVGFGSAEAFARAFKRRFGCSATEWRRQQAAPRRAHNSNPDQVKSRIDQAPFADPANHGGSQSTEAESPMNVTLIERQPVTVAYLRHTGPYGPSISRFWRDTVYPWMVTNGLLGLPRYGISHDDPGITAPEQCRYDAGVEVPSRFVVTGVGFKTTLPGGKYAVLPFKGTAAEFPAAWKALLGDWLPASGLQLDARPFFEHYPRDAVYDEATGVLSCEICVPVVPL